MNEAAWILRHARRRAGLTQRALAGKAGVAPSYVSRVETSRADPTVTSLSRLLRACGTTLEAMPGSGEGVDRTLFPLDLSPGERMERARRIANDPDAVLRRLVEHGVLFVLVGDRAAATYGWPVRQDDVDVCHDVSPANLQRLGVALRALNARPRVAGERLDPDALSRDGVVRLDTDEGPLDLVARPSGTGGHADLAANATEVVLGGAAVAVASLDDLVRIDRRRGGGDRLLALLDATR